MVGPRTEDRTRAGGKGAKRPARKGGRISAEERAAMTDAEDSLGKALGSDVRVPRRDGVKAELRFDDLDEVGAVVKRLRRRS